MIYPHKVLPYAALLSLCIALFPSIIFAQQQSSEALPVGYYTYLGPDPRKPAPLRFSIAKNGALTWYDTTPVLASAKSRSGNKNIESESTGLIKWKPRPVSGMPGVFVQLTTSGLRYKCILLGAKKSLDIKITLLDVDDFKMMDFTISGFKPIEGTQLMEAEGRRDSQFTGSVIYNYSASLEKI